MAIRVSHPHHPPAPLDCCAQCGREFAPASPSTLRVALLIFATTMLAAATVGLLLPLGNALVLAVPQ